MCIRDSTWSDIDFEKKKIKVCKQLLYQDKQWCFAPLKTVNSYRPVNITAEFAQYLADMKMQHDAEMCIRDRNAGGCVCRSLVHRGVAAHVE